MRRRFGADHVELNTIEQWAKAYLHEPVRIDFTKFVEAAASANVPTTSIELEIEGAVQESTAGLRFEVAGTEQSFPIEAGFLKPGDSGRIHADIGDFAKQPRIVHLPHGLVDTEPEAP